MNSWADCKNVLCIRADNMGDVLMSSPAIRSLHTEIGCKITLLTSGKGAAVAKLISAIDEVIAFDLPWIKADHAGTSAEQINDLLENLKSRCFDGCVIFTVYSQNPMPAIMLAYLAGIPLRLAYCRENPYDLLTDWFPDPEPLTLIKHQVQRDLDLLNRINIRATERRIRLDLSEKGRLRAKEKLSTVVDVAQPFIIMHPGVSEPKREYPLELWARLGRRLIEQTGLKLLLTGSAAESQTAEFICRQAGPLAINACGQFDVEEFAAVIGHAAVVVSVNTGTVHLAAAMQRPIVVLYAQSNPQHTPWLVRNCVLPYSVAPALKSRNKIIAYVDQKYYEEVIPPPTVESVLLAVQSLLVLKPEEQGG
jgi:ADP-heptose:LPS heptosyltransferase